MEAEAWRLIGRSTSSAALGADAGFPQQEIADSGYGRSSGGRRRAGGGRREPLRSARRAADPHLRLDDALEREQVESVRAVKAARSQAEVAHQLRRVADACRGGQNLCRSWWTP
jgi:hypothetical protein